MKAYKLFYQIEAGFQKWIYRYGSISECPGQRKKGYYSKKVRKIANKTWQIMLKIKHRLDGDFDVANADWRNDYYHHDGTTATTENDDR